MKARVAPRLSSRETTYYSIFAVIVSLQCVCCDFDCRDLYSEVEEGTGLNISITCTNNNRFVVTYERVGSSLGNLLTILYTCELNNGTTLFENEVFIDRTNWPEDTKELVLLSEHSTTVCWFYGCYEHGDPFREDVVVYKTKPTTCAVAEPTMATTTSIASTMATSTEVSTDSHNLTSEIVSISISCAIVLLFFLLSGLLFVFFCLYWRKYKEKSVYSETKCPGDYGYSGYTEEIDMNFEPLDSIHPLKIKLSPALQSLSVGSQLNYLWVEGFTYSPTPTMNNKLPLAQIRMTHTCTHGYPSASSDSDSYTCQSSDDFHDCCCKGETNDQDEVFKVFATKQQVCMNSQQSEDRHSSASSPELINNELGSCIDSNRHTREYGEGTVALEATENRCTCYLCQSSSSSIIRVKSGQPNHQNQYNVNIDGGGSSTDQDSAGYVVFN